MNLAKRGLILDGKGQIVRPKPPVLDFESSTARDLGVEITDIIRNLFRSGASPLTLQAAVPGILSTTKAPRRTPTRTSKRRQNRPETPLEYHKRVKKELGLLDIDQDIREMSLETLRHHFGYKNKKIQRGLFCRNVVWQVLRYTKAGKPPMFVQNGGNVRSLWYHVKALVGRHAWSFGKNVEYDGLFSEALTEITNAGLMEYRELNFIDQNRVNRWVAPHYGTKNLIIMAEKRAFSEELLSIGRRYGVTVQATGGVPSRVTTETMLLEMAEAGHDLTQPFIVFAMVDFDPDGWNIAQTFVEHMLGLGLKKIKAFQPYGRDRPRQPWIDIVSVGDLNVDFIEENRHPLKIGKRSKALGDEWVSATGGLYGRGGKQWALSSEVFLGLVDEHLEKKLPKHLSNLELYQQIVAYQSLDQPFKNYIAAKLSAQM